MAETVVPQAAGPQEVVPQVVVPQVVVPLTIRDLTPADLQSCGWSGGQSHLASVALALERADRGEVEYLAACPPSGLPVGLCGIDYVKRPAAGYLWQLAVHQALQSCGIGTRLIRAAEQRIRARGLDRSELAVEERNPRARALYERLGYVAYASELDGWHEDRKDGSVVWYETICTLMSRDLGSGEGDGGSHGAPLWAAGLPSGPAGEPKRGRGAPA